MSSQPTSLPSSSLKPQQVQVWSRRGSLFGLYQKDEIKPPADKVGAILSFPKPESKRARSLGTSGPSQRLSQERKEKRQTLSAMYT